MISLSEAPRVTIALKRNCCPFPACLINSRAAKRPIRPKPYKTTSLGSTLLELVLANPTNLFERKAAFDSKFDNMCPYYDEHGIISKIIGIDFDHTVSFDYLKDNEDISKLGLRPSDSFVKTQMCLAMAHGVTLTLSKDDCVNITDKVLNDLFHIDFLSI